MSRTLAIIKPDGYYKNLVEEIMDRINSKGFKIIEDVETVLTTKTVTNFYRHHKGAKFFDDLVHYMSNKKVRLLVLEKINAVDEWRRVLDQIREEHSGPLKYETVVHGSKTDIEARKEIEMLFGLGVYLL